MYQMKGHKQNGCTFQLNVHRVNSASGRTK